MPRSCYILIGFIVVLFFAISGAILITRSIRPPIKSIPPTVALRSISTTSENYQETLLAFNDTDSWQRYTDPDLGFSFLYPTTSSVYYHQGDPSWIGPKEVETLHVEGTAIDEYIDVFRKPASLEVKDWFDTVDTPNEASFVPDITPERGYIEVSHQQNGYLESSPDGTMKEYGIFYVALMAPCFHPDQQFPMDKSLLLDKIVLTMRLTTAGHTSRLSFGQQSLLDSIRFDPMSCH